MSSSSRRGAVVWRETTRSARRWQTYASRAGFSAVLFAVLVLGIWAVTSAASWDLVDTTSAPWLGRALFTTFSLAQMFIGLILAPIVTSRAMVEERTEGTLDLLVLTPITAASLLAGKVGSRLILLGTIVLGSLPLLALATTLGGVAVHEVVLVTLGNAVTVITLGIVGAFFGLFTRSPIVAMVASFGWSLLAFLALPGLFALLVASGSATAQVSPFFVALGDWSGLVLPLTWAPSVWLTWFFASRLFDLQISRAAKRRFFDNEVWAVRPGLYLLVAFGIATVTVLPLGVVLCWVNQQSTDWTAVAFYAVGWLLCFAWTQGLILLGGWTYLRMGMDLVDAIEGMLDGLGTSRSGQKLSVGHRIWANPIAWRELRISAWGRGVVPLIVVWGLVMFAVAQTLIWMVPGGLLTLGIANAMLALLLTVWASVGSIEQERAGRSLDLLRLSTMSSWRIVLGKLIGVAAPSLPLLGIASVLIVVGLPHLGLLTELDEGNGFGLVALTVRGVLTALWLFSLWFLVAMIGFTAALRMRSPATAYGLTGGGVTVVLLGASFLAYVLGHWYWASMPFRLISPAMVPGNNLIELLVGVVWVGVLGVVLARRLVLRLRMWGEAS